ncbi:MAG: metal ABC transporter substrate-binding protein [Moorea sp. SIO2B7]|nr:metal ABC transporter substrate-binding protein [Moorena sp. SIO2B7]
MRGSDRQQNSRRRLSAAVWLILALYLGGCAQPVSKNSPSVQESSKINANAPQNPDTEKKKVILTTFTVLADIVRNVAGDAAVVDSLTKIGSEIHGYEPTPSDLVRAQKADLILDNGFGLERWAQKFYSNIKNVPHVTLSEGIEPINISEDAYQGKPNPHAWMSPKLALIYVENIRQALVDLDPQNAAIYNKNAEVYSKNIKAIDETLRETIAVVPPEKRYMVTCEGAFSYLARDYGLKEVYLWAVNSEKQATPKQVQKVIKTVEKNKIPTVFCESTVSGEAQKQVAKETGANFGGVFYVDSLSKSDGPVPSYLKLMRYNVKTLVKGLK